MIFEIKGSVLLFQLPNSNNDFVPDDYQKLKKMSNLSKPQLQQSNHYEIEGHAFIVSLNKSLKT